jgi:hypothetical protein
MSTELPIACSLDAPALADRLAEIRAIGEEALIAVDGCVVRFHRSDDIRARLDAVVRAESECCPFLTLALVQTADELVLTIGAPDDAALVAEELAAAFAA